MYIVDATPGWPSVRMEFNGPLLTKRRPRCAPRLPPGADVDCERSLPLAGHGRYSRHRCGWWCSWALVANLVCRLAAQCYAQRASPPARRNTRPPVSGRLLRRRSRRGPPASGRICSASVWSSGVGVSTTCVVLSRCWRGRRARRRGGVNSVPAWSTGDAASPLRLPCASA